MTSRRFAERVGPRARQAVAGPAADYRPGFAARALALLLAAFGAALLALEAWQAWSVPDWLASGAAAGVPLAGFLIAGALLLVLPQRRLKARTIAFACAITALALGFDWLAFGPGARAFTDITSAGGARAVGALGERAGRIGFGIAGIYLSALAVALWRSALRMRSGTDASMERHD